MFTIQSEASRIALRAHEHQEYGGRPYYEHLYDVVGNITEMYEDSDSLYDDSILQAAGWLHDVVEDTNITLNLLYGFGVPKEVIDLVDAVTKREGESHEQYLNRIVAAGANAIKLKIADSRANLEMSLKGSVSEQQNYRVHKYAQNIIFLNKALLDEATK